MGTKIVYNKSNGIEVLAYEDQVTAGLFHLPAGSTEVKPPSFNTETHTCKFIDDDWVIAVIPEPEDTGLKEKDADTLPLTYADKRQEEYPSIQDLVVALYDPDDKADIEAKRAEVKKKYPKP